MNSWEAKQFQGPISPWLPSFIAGTPNGQGVTEALTKCAETWMNTVLRHSAALVVVLLGPDAQEAADELWELDASKKVQFNVPVAGRNRAVARLPLPGAGTPATFEKSVDADNLSQLRGLFPPN